MCLSNRCPGAPRFENRVWILRLAVKNEVEEVLTHQTADAPTSKALCHQSHLSLVTRRLVTASRCAYVTSGKGKMWSDDRKLEVFSCVLKQTVVSFYLSFFMFREKHKKKPETTMSKKHWMVFVKCWDCCSSLCCFCITGSIQGYVLQLGSFHTIKTVYVEECHLTHRLERYILLNTFLRALTATPKRQI